MEAEATKPLEDGTTASQGDSPEKRIALAFESPAPPSLVATSPFQMTLQWKQLRRERPQEDPHIEGLALNFALLMRLVRPATFKPAVLMGSQVTIGDHLDAQLIERCAIQSDVNLPAGNWAA